MNLEISSFKNPFKPGAGHMPPYLAGRVIEQNEFLKLLKQDIILENMILTGLRGVGKTVLLESLKPVAIQKDWLWVGTDLSESTSITENNLAIRILTDLSVITSAIVISKEDRKKIGFDGEEVEKVTALNYDTLLRIFESTPGLVSDKLKKVLEVAWSYISLLKKKGLIFAYDEAQNLADHLPKDQFPLSLLLDVFQSIQKKDIPFMLVLTGLPTLFPKLVESRTYSERMFRVIFLDQLNEDERKDAILKPIEDEGCPVTFSEQSVDIIAKLSGGYPYFIQFICREVYDVFIQKLSDGEEGSVPTIEIIRKLDSDFFAGRWARATDRQRELLEVAAKLDNCDSEFTVQELVALSKTVLENPFSSSHVNQMLSTLSVAGLVFKNRFGKYSFAVPLLNKFILRQLLIK